MNTLDTEERCFELRLPLELRLSDAAEVALEDYARALSGSRSAEAVRDGEPGGPVVAVRFRGLAQRPEDRCEQDVVAFALELQDTRESGGLGWS